MKASSKRLLAAAIPVARGDRGRVPPASAQDKRPQHERGEVVVMRRAQSEVVRPIAALAVVAAVGACVKKMTEIQTRRCAILRPGAFVLGLALLTGGCASSSPSGSSSGMTSQELYNEYDANNDNQITQQEWDQAYKNMDTNGDGAVTSDEYHAAVSQAGGGGRR